MKNVFYLSQLGSQLQNTVDADLKEMFSRKKEREKDKEKKTFLMV